MSSETQRYLAVMPRHREAASSAEITRLDPAAAVYDHLGVAVLNLDEDGLAQAKGSGHFERIEPDREVKTVDLVVPWNIIKVGARRARRVTDGTGVRVAVLDTGLDRTHPDLRANIAGGYNFVANNAFFDDDNGHGTHVAGVIAANGSYHLVGCAPGCTLYGLKVLDYRGYGYYSWVIAALDWCVRNHVHVANLSLGGTAYSRAFRKACVYAYYQGVLQVAAAGNQGCRRRGSSILYPARFWPCIAVGAIARNGVRPRWSSCGQQLELCAPGVNIYSTYYGNSYVTLSGTSQACPHVTGIAALIKARLPGYTMHRIRLMMRSAARYPTSNRSRRYYGYGMVRLPTRLL
ncbi:MAG: S8 family peptidase [Bacillota bacterium]